MLFAVGGGASKGKMDSYVDAMFSLMYLFYNETFFPMSMRENNFTSQ
jgi:hypothetical protein